jgi:general secretion pathway protein I
VNRRHGSGFTLIEVLIALVIAAIALSAISRVVAQSIDTTAALRDRELGTWVAQNQLAQLRLTHAWPPTDTTDGDTELAGRHWRWTQVVATTPYPGLRRVEISVSGGDSKHHVAELIGFLRKPESAP